MPNDTVLTNLDLGDESIEIWQETEMKPITELIIDVVNGKTAGRIERYGNRYVLIQDGDRIEVTKTVQMMLKSGAVTPVQIAEAGR